MQGNFCKELRKQNLFACNKYHLNRSKWIQTDALEIKANY